MHKGRPITFRMLKLGTLFRFPSHDNPWRGTQTQEAIWKKISQVHYINTKNASRRNPIGNPHRQVWEEQAVAGH